MRLAAVRHLLSASFAARIGQPRVLGPGELVGVEHEYRIWRHHRGGSMLCDARLLGALLSTGEPHLDPADPYARRQRSGGVMTCDGREVEISIAPVPVAMGFAAAAARRIILEERRLRRSLRRPFRLEGYSTHLSVAMPDRLADAVARQYVRSFAPAMMLLMDGLAAPGLLVRPRPGRLELGGSHVPASRLAVVATFAVGSALACANAIKADRNARGLPPALALAVEPALDRYGWYVDRRAPGCDLYALGRSATLRLTSGERWTAGRYLEEAWASARRPLEAVAMENELLPIDALVEGRLPLPVEESGSTERSREIPRPFDEHDADERNDPFGVSLAPRGRGVRAAPVLLTWSRAVFLLLADGFERPAFASVPVSRLECFLSLLAGGSLDRIVARYVDHDGPVRRLDDPGRAARAGLYDALGPRVALLPPERQTSRAPFAEAAPPRTRAHPWAGARWLAIR
ncbi:MAG TPA: hypothetical protein VGQ47_01940 [Candidatus Limnocylindrales bacterium]|nr:hypothetical protein [Candidatus Limnocylindrales bacterium]